MPPLEAKLASLSGTWLVFLPFALAIGGTLAAYRFNEWAPSGSTILVLGATAVLFGVLSMLAALRLSAVPHWALVLLMLGGIAVGVFIDAVVSEEDRNLFPFEIALLWLVLVAPIFAGAWLGRSLHARRQRHAQK
jgi:hypothetical protein